MLEWEKNHTPTGKVKNGQVTQGYESCILTTNIKELFNHIVEIGSDLEFTSTKCGAPSMLVSNMNIAGSNEE